MIFLQIFISSPFSSLIFFFITVAVSVEKSVRLFVGVKGLNCLSTSENFSMNAGVLWTKRQCRYNRKKNARKEKKIFKNSNIFFYFTKPQSHASSSMSDDNSRNDIMQNFVQMKIQF